MKASNPYETDGCVVQIAGVETLGELVKRLRTRSGMSHGVLANKMGVTPQTIANLENERTKSLKSQAMMRLVEVFGEPIKKWLEERTPEMPPRTPKPSDVSDPVRIERMQKEFPELVRGMTADQILQAFRILTGEMAERDIKPPAPETTGSPGSPQTPGEEGDRPPVIVQGLSDSEVKQAAAASKRKRRGPHSRRANGAKG